MGLQEIEKALDTEIEELQPDWENPPSVSDLNQDFKDARPDHDAHVSDIDTWLDNLNITGKAKPPEIKGRSSVQPKLIRKQAEWRYPALTEPFLSTDDLFNVSPTTHLDKEAAKQNELVLNYQFNTKIDKVAFIDEYVRTAVDEGTVTVRLGWDFEEAEREVEEPIFEMKVTEDQSVAEIHKNIQAKLSADPGSKNTIPKEMLKAHKLTVETGQLYIPVKNGTRTVTKVITIKNHPTVEICDYRNTTIDPTSKGKISKANFIISSFETSLADLERDGKYKNLDAINIEGNSPLSHPDHDEPEEITFQFTDKPRKRFVAYEYWGFWDINKDGTTVPIVATYVGDVMIRLEENPYPDGALPYVTVHYLPKRKAVYGEPDGELLEDNQKIIGAITRGMIDVMGRSANGQMAIRKDALDITNRRRFERGLDYEYNANISPIDAFYQHTYPEIPASAPGMIQMQNSDAESLTGVKSFADSGISGESLGQVASLGRGALDAASKRELGILRRLSAGVIEIGRKIIAMNGEFLDETEVVRITDEEFVEVKRDDLAGNFDLKLTISTAEEDNQKAQELAFMLQTMGQSLPPEMTQIIMADIARLRKMPTLAKRIEEYQPQPDPKQELEVQLLQAQIAKEQAAAAENNAQAMLHQAKTQESIAKARALGSDADMRDLDYVEQESGTKHERDRDIVTSQAEAQGRTKILEANLKKSDKQDDLNNKLIENAINNAPEA